MKKLLCFGDSLTAGYCKMGLEFYPYATTLQSLLGGSHTVDHIGLSGWTTRQMLQEKNEQICEDCCGEEMPGLVHKLKEYSPGECNYVFILAGTNDIGYSYAVEETLSNLEELATVCFPWCDSVGLLTVPACGHDTGVTTDARSRINKGIKSIQAKYAEKVFVVDIFEQLPQGPPVLGSPDIWDRDKLHLSKDGSEALARIVFDAIQSRSS